MLRIQSDCPRFGVIVPLTEGFKRFLTESFLAMEQLARAGLRRPAVDVRRSIFEVKNEPELNARVRHGNLDAVRPSLRDCPLKVWVFILVEHAPNLIPSRATTSTFLALCLAFRRNRVVDQGHRNPMFIGEGDLDLGSVSTVPIHDVILLGALALDEDEQLTLDRRTRYRSRGPSRATAGGQGAPSPAVISSAICRNRSFEMMGVAP